MYERYWELQESPFLNQLDERWYFENPYHDEALARLFYLVEQIRRCGVLVGPPGSGKSLLLKILTRQALRTQRRVVYLDLFGTDGAEVLWQLVAGLQLAPGPKDSTLTHWRKLREHLESLHLARVQSVLVFDHLERARGSAWEVLERLLHLVQGPMVWQNGHGSWLTLLAATHEPDSDRAKQFLRHCAELKIELPALDEQLTPEYIRELLRLAGGRPSLFEPEALEFIHSVSRGIPREINRIAHLSLLAGMGEEQTALSEALVRSVLEELEPFRIAG